MRAARRSECSGLGNAPVAERAAAQRLRRRRAAGRRAAGPGRWSSESPERSPTDATTRAVRLCGGHCRGDGERVGEVVDVGQLRQVEHGQPGRLQRLPGAGRRCRRATSARRRAPRPASALCSPSAHQPPSGAVPRTAVAGAGGLEQLRAPASSSAVTCGVSMPMSSVGAGPPVMASANAAASRVPRSPSTCGHDGEAVEVEVRRGAPSRATTRPATGAARTASRVSPTAAAAIAGGLLRACTAGSAGSCSGRVPVPW